VGWARPHPKHRALQLHPAWSLSLVVLIVPANRTHTFRARRWRVVNAEKSFDSPNHTTNWSGNNGANRAGDAEALSRAMLEAAGKSTLRLSGDRRRQGCNNNARVQD
jgi:hypothetical protein